MSYTLCLLVVRHYTCMFVIICIYLTCRLSMIYLYFFYFFFHLYFQTAFPKSENLESDLQKATNEVIHLREEESKLRHENLRLKVSLSWVKFSYTVMDGGVDLQIRRLLPLAYTRCKWCSAFHIKSFRFYWTGYYSVNSMQRHWMKSFSVCITSNPNVILSLSFVCYFFAIFKIAHNQLKYRQKSTDIISFIMFVTCTIELKFQIFSFSPFGTQ